MSSKLYQIKEHVIEGQHVREFPRATAGDQNAVLKLHMKQYIPLDNLNPKPGDVTIIGAHANGFPKELYEPLWDELLLRAKGSNLRIRSIWIADVAHQGQSGILNEHILGNDPSWDDHPRDLLHMINTFRDQMPRPIIGIGHSFGGANLVRLSLIHPRLLSTLVLIDPVIQGFSSAQGNYVPAALSTFRRDKWPSRSAAAASFKKSKFYQAWDPRVLELWIKYGLRDMPTYIYPKTTSNETATAMSTPLTAEPATAPVPEEKGVTLTTTKHQEVFTFLRPAFPSQEINHYTHPDRTAWTHPNSPFYRGEPVMIFNQLPHVRPSVLYIFGALSALSEPQTIKEKMERTGTGVGGSGGAKEGRVKQVTFQNVGHLIPMERVEDTASETMKWMSAEMEFWQRQEVALEKQWQGRTGIERSMVWKEWEENMGFAFKAAEDEKASKKPSSKL